MDPNGLSETQPSTEKNTKVVPTTDSSTIVADAQLSLLVCPPTTVEEAVAEAAGYLWNPFPSWAALCVFSGRG